MDTELESEMNTDESENEFAFETDHLALRGNEDYCKLLKYIVKLEAQKAHALKDIEHLADAENKALDDPFTFIENLKNGSLNFPERQHVMDLPRIDWSKYGIDPKTNQDDSLYNESKQSNLKSPLKVRGKKFTDNKAETFNQLWSCEEQKRLEELLEIYPEERVEFKRYEKISKALGTRTPIQVISRVQKYFSKLAKAGLPIPGRIRKGMSLLKEKKSSILYKKSTFFPQLHVPVKMEDQFESSVESEYIGGSSSTANVILLLKAAKTQRALDERSPVWQTNVMCVGCHKTRFVGARWTDNAGTDYCTDCVVKLLPSEKLIPIRH